MLEKDIEQKIKAFVASRGGRCLKFVSPSHVGVPDRIVLLPGGVVGFLEVKQPKGRLSEIQEIEIAKFQALGASVAVVRSVAEAEAAINEWLSAQEHRAKGRTYTMTYGTNS